MTRESDLHYIAGFFDGEGNIYINVEYKNGKKRGRTPYHHVRVTISNTNRDILEWMKSIIGGGIYGNKNHESNSKWQQGYMLILASQTARVFLSEIAPYLKMKRKQAELALTIDNGHAGALTNEEIVRRDSITKAVSAYNGAWGRVNLDGSKKVVINGIVI
jgi:hypothetical protein